MYQSILCNSQSLFREAAIFLNCRSIRGGGPGRGGGKGPAIIGKKNFFTGANPKHRIGNAYLFQRKNINCQKLLLLLLLLDYIIERVHVNLLHHSLIIIRLKYILFLKN